MDEDLSAGLRYVLSCLRCPGLQLKEKQIGAIKIMKAWIYLFGRPPAMVSPYAFTVSPFSLIINKEESAYHQINKVWFLLYLHWCP